MNEPFIKIKNLSYAYDDDNSFIPAVSDVSLEIEKGSYVAITGRNGSGKSTLAKLMNMILESVSGEISINGKKIDLDSFSDEEIIEFRRKIGMVFQNPDNQLVATIVEDDVAFGPENLGVPSEEIRKRVDDALESVGMSEYATHEPHRLSGGQKQRVAIAGIIAMMPECIIFDESTAMLDPYGRKEVVDMMEKLNREMGITIITITHYMDEAVRADRVIVMDRGKIIMDGTPNEVFSRSDEIRAAGLELPQCADLVGRLRKRGIKLDGDCTTPEKSAELILSALKK